MLTLLTLTGDRPDQFALCEKYVGRFSKTYDEWIVIDDGERPTACTMGQRVIRLQPGRPAAQSFLTNLMVGIRAVQSPNIAFIEDDDWYHHLYLSWVNQQLDDHTLVGEAPSIYYNIEYRRIRNMGNRGHASLCQTACRTDLARQALRHCKGTGFDLLLWQEAVPKFLTKTRQPFVVGMKGHLSGRKGIGVGHRPAGDQWQTDPDMERLEALIGSDVENYR